MAEDLSEYFRAVVKNSCTNAIRRGFKRQGLILRYISDQAVGVIQFQRSRTNTKKRLSFTIELAIVVKALSVERDANFDRVSCADGQLRQRIGMLLPEKTDKWWDIDYLTEVENLTAEISNLISEVAVPYVEGYLNLHALEKLWESQQSPGLTAIQRANYLDQLRCSLRGRRV